MSKQQTQKIRVVVDRSTGVVRGYGATVAEVTPLQVWDVTPDPETFGALAGAHLGLFEARGQVASAVGADARIFLVSIVGDAFRFTAIDPATGLAANVDADPLFLIDRSGIEIGA